MGLDKLHFYFTGGCLALDFVNSKSWRLSDEPNERLQDFSGFLQFCQQALILTPVQFEQASNLSDGNPADAASTLGQAIKLRELIYRLFRCKALSDEVSRRDLEQFNRLLKQAQQRFVSVEGSSWTLDWGAELNTLNRLWWPIALDASRILITTDSSPIKICGGDGCGWLFLDTSRNQQRRWCDMRVCGNRDKVKRYQHSKK